MSRQTLTWVAVSLVTLAVLFGCPCPVVTYDGKPAHGIRLAPEPPRRRRHERVTRGQQVVPNARELNVVQLPPCHVPRPRPRS
jgi:hypothetical protein